MFTYLGMEHLKTAVASNLSKTGVERFAELLSEQLGYKPGQELEPIIQELGGALNRVDFWFDNTPPPALRVEPGGTFTLSVPSHNSYFRNRFTIAHELGHYFLHYLLDDAVDKDTDYFEADRSGRNERVEWEANWFASAMLMPRSLYIKKYKKLDGLHDELSDFFNVSISASQIRAQSLDLE